MNDKEKLTPAEASEILGVSTATVKNWIKLKKLKAQTLSHALVIDMSELSAFKKTLDNSPLLTSRRNKSRQNNNFIPKNYIAPDSPNLRVISELISSLPQNDIRIDSVLNYYSLSLMKQGGVRDVFSSRLSFDAAPSKELCDFLSGYSLTLVDGEDTLGMLYISLRRLTDKKKSGSYYTPFFAVDKIISSLDFGKINALCDPSCGTGNFLLRLPDAFPIEKIHGFDIDETAIKLARINLAIKFRLASEADFDLLEKNIRKKDYLLSEPLRGLYDAIIGNPPWGYSYESIEKKQLQKLYFSAEGSKKPESFCLFIEKALSELKGFGSLVFLLPESVLGADFYRSIRHYITENSSISSISYLGEIFDKVQCPCIALALCRGKEDDNALPVTVSYYKKNVSARRLSSCLELQKTYEVPACRITEKSFHILADNREYEIIKRISSAEHFTLKNNADFALGIVTGSNKDFLKDVLSPGYEGILKGKDIHKYYHDEPDSFIRFTPEAFQQVAPKAIYRSGEKLIYKFIADEPVFAYDDRGMLTLNSANILIPRVKGYSMAYIMAILNSPIISYYYRHTCKNMKMLRSAIESLPIAVCENTVMSKISSLALAAAATPAESEAVNEINQMIFNLYGISENALI